MNLMLFSFGMGVTHCGAVKKIIKEISKVHWMLYRFSNH